MLFDKVQINNSGNYQRGSVTIGLVGEMKCSIEFASNALSIQLPINAHRALMCYPHPSLDAARNLAIEDWLLQLRQRRSKNYGTTEHLFLWPTNSYIRWDAINEAIQTHHPILKIGDAYCFSPDAIDPDAKPWFKDGKWQGREPLEARALVSDENQFITNDPQLAVTGTGDKSSDIRAEQLFVTCIPSLGNTSLIWLSHALQLAAPVACVRLLAVMKNREVADARNMLVKQILQIRPRPEYIFWYGDDNLPDANSLQLLFESLRKEKANACAGVYHMKYRPPVQPLLWKNGKPGWLIPGTDYKDGDLLRVSGTGMDFCVVRTECYEKMPYPWFKTGMENDGKGMRIFTEDAWHWEQYVRDVGEEVLVDTRCKIGHYDAYTGQIF